VDNKIITDPVKSALFGRMTKVLSTGIKGMVVIEKIKTSELQNKLN
jgi:hypothetical protein